ncbi:AraC-like DNA-binding protein [Paenibacillus shirakamiensis]|uniref:AraC-like DNA-binding protein n=1 Tax=Paenibacillus shirakamiensis TaxID=1265935 RepID=A0ABS4JE34_9BACL|nr:AraC family transcriptional regulator [Paenibacillus shirakamiensis]MBP1999972.1 AraC-like DNA-binding protein [Paenibacillus shirakamiensis]
MNPQADETHSIYLLSSVRMRKYPKTGQAVRLNISVHMLCYVMEGEGFMVLDGSLQKIRPLQLYLLVPGMILEFPEHSPHFVYYGICFEPIMLMKKQGEYEANRTLPLYKPTLLPGFIPVQHPQWLLEKIVHLFHLSKTYHRDRMELRLPLEELILAITQCPSEVPSTTMDVRIVQSILFMEKHFIEKIKMEQLAQVAGMLAPTAFSRLFRSETGMSPVDYLNQIRMSEAKKMLGMKNSRVKEIAAAVGFRSEFYFSRRFQSSVGVTPTLFKNRDTLKVAVATSLGFDRHLISLGVAPVCVVDLFHYPGQPKEKYTELLRSRLTLLSESMPDLIIADHYHIAFKEQFKQIATPLFLDFSTWDWKANFNNIAELVNRERQAKEVLTRLEIEMETTGKFLRQTLGKERITILQVNHRAIGIQGKTHHPLNQLIYEQLALLPGNQVPSDLWRMEVQPQTMPILETEHLFIHHHHKLAGSEQMYTKLTQIAAWPMIPAVQQDKVQHISNWFLMSWTPEGRQQIMKELLATFS